jgi:hypothetical protein
MSVGVSDMKLLIGLLILGLVLIIAGVVLLVVLT